MKQTTDTEDSVQMYKVVTYVTDGGNPLDGVMPKVVHAYEHPMQFEWLEARCKVDEFEEYLEKMHIHGYVILEVI